MSLPERLSTKSTAGDRGGGTEQRRDSDASEYTTTASEKHLVQRCVIIQKDERGYGLTVSGDNPVYVASVKPEGAAAKAGVQKDDRIVKVNGTLVTNRNHIEVVKLIRSGSYVALTLMGKPNLSDGGQLSGSGPPVDNSANRLSRVTAPQPVHPNTDRELSQHKVHMTRVMLEQAREDFLKQQKYYVKTPSEKLHAQLLEKERTVRTLENQLRALTGGEEPTTPIPPRVSDIDQQPDSNNSWAASLPVASDLSELCDSPLHSPSVSPTPLHPHNTRHHHDDVLNTNQTEPGVEQAWSAPTDQLSMAPTHPDIISIDDEDMDDDDDQGTGSVVWSANPPHSPFLSRLQAAETADVGPFSDLRLLEKRPAHLAVFLHYLISNSDPCALLFYTVTDAYKQTKGSTNDLRKWGYEIVSTFLLPSAPLRVEVSDSLLSRVNEVLSVGSSRNENELVLRGLFDGCRAALSTELNDQLVEFRNIRARGLGNIFGVHELSESMEKSGELRMVEKYLMPHLQYCSEDSGQRKLSDRDQAMGWALATLLRQVGLTKTTSSNILERVQSFITKDKKSGFKLPRPTKPKNVKGHQFNLQHFYVPTQCAQCEGLIWGVGHQGLICHSCEMGVHKQCVEDVSEVCGGKKRAKVRNSVPAARPKPATLPGVETGAQAVAVETRSPPPSGTDSTASVNIQPLPKDDSMELEKLSSELLVKNMVKTIQDPTSPADHTSAETDTLNTEKRKGSTELGRSESWKEKGDKAEQSTRRAKSDVGREEIHAFNLESGSSSTSTLSNWSGESGSNSSEHVNDSVVPRTTHDDSDLEVEDLPALKQVLGDEISRLKPKEKKRQEVINELFHTEKAHLRNLKVLDRLFCRPMQGEGGVMAELAHALFPNLEEIITLHASMNKAMKERRSQTPVVGDVGDILLDRFDGEQGDRFRKACAEYCRNQSFALEALKRHRRKDQRLSQFLVETEADKLCRKLELKDHVPGQMQRLTKYPLLIDNLLKYTKTSSSEHKKLEKAHERSKHILAYVNQAVRECQNFHKLKDMQKKLDTRSIDASSDSNLAAIKKLDLTQHKLVFDGPLVWRLRSHRLMDLHVLLMEDILVLLQRVDDRLVLKCHSTNLTPIANDFKYTHSPVLKLHNLLARDVATDKKAFFVINTSDTGPQIYELVAQTQDARKTWCRLINEKAEEQKKSVAISGKMPRLQESPAAEEEEMIRVRERILRTGRSSSSPPGDEEQRSVASDAGSRQDSVDRLSSIQPDLMQPPHVTQEGPVTAATTNQVLSPVERLQRSDQVLQQALAEKEAVVSEILHLSGGGDAPLTQESGGGGEGEDESEQSLVLSCLQSNHRLIQLLTTSATAFALHSQPDSAASPQPASLTPDSASGGQTGIQGVNIPLPLNQLQSLALEMKSVLSSLTRVMGAKEEERQTLQSQLEAAHKQLAMLKVVQQQIMGQHLPSPQSRPLSLLSFTSSVSEAGECTDSEPADEDTVSVLDLAQAQQLTQDVLPTAKETVTQLHTQHLETTTTTTTASNTSNTNNTATIEDDDSDEDTYRMIPDNLPLPDDNCLQPISPFPALEEREEEREGEKQEKEGERQERGEREEEGGCHHMTTDLDEGGEDVDTTSPPSLPPAAHTEEEEERESDQDGERGLAAQEDSTEEGKQEDRKEGRDVAGREEEREDNPPNSDVCENSEAEQNWDKTHNLQNTDNNNFTCPDSELTSPIDI